MASLSLKNIEKVYPNGFKAVQDFNLEIADKEFFIFLPRYIIYTCRILPSSY